jgi:hypothetical protein
MSTFSGLFDSATVPLLAVFSEEATYYPRAGASHTITLVFDTGEQVQTSQRVYQTAWAPLTSFTSGEPCKGDHLTLDGTTYRVADVEKDTESNRLLKLAVTNPL